MALSGLDSALSGLRVAQQQLSVISTNISNVGTDGYTRKILPQSTIAVGGEALGVRGDAIIRNVDLNLERDFWTQVSTVSNLDTKATYLNRIQEFHGAPDLEISIAAEIAELRDKFSALADSPEDHYLQRSVVDQGVVIANKINDFAGLLTEMRNDAQDDIDLSVQNVNNLLSQIAELNKQIKSNINIGKTSAALEDQRDELIRQLSEEIEISFFVRGDGVLVVQTGQGVQLADERAETLYFQNSNIGPQSYYPASAYGLYVGDPATPTAIEITETGLNGHLGALFELRDEILPEQMAMLDELAHKMALRFDAQGLQLFTDASGQIPADTAPVPDPPGPLTPVDYVGFSTEIQVNSQILADSTLVQTGTAANDLPVQSGSNEVVRRVVEYVFGEVEYQEAVGTVDVRANGSGAVTMQEWLGLYSENQITGTTNLSSYTDVNALLAAGGDVFAVPPPSIPPWTDEFQIIFEEPRLGLGPETITINLNDAAAIPLGPGVNDALDQIIAEINNEIAALPVDPGFAAVASRSPYGQLIIETRGNVTLDASSTVTSMGQDGLDFLGLTEGTYQTVDPYFDVQVGNAPPVRVTIEPGDTETELLDKLEYDVGTQTGVPGLYVDMDVATGVLTLRPGNDDSNAGPVFGGDIKIIGGPFVSDGTGGSGVALNATVLESLFGSNNPITDVLYGASAPFRSANLGPGVNIDTGTISSSTLIDYSQKLVNRQAEEILITEARMTDEKTFQDLLQGRLLDESGVNIEEELANLIVVQTAFAASARTITAIDEMFRELLNAV
ncbi:MAG: flagellar hook-associated protein FlgK [Rhodospirillales bacterium]|nr:flagellar hook-associated protein FlgK [Rhodospirillales bacterium]